MEPVVGFRPNQPVNWFSRDKARSNHYCLYCGRFVGPGSTVKSNKEHLIARKLVPPGKLKGTDFNFIFRGCTDCNSLKAAAERHVSTITLLTSSGRASDPEVDAVADHKASRDFHPQQKGRLVRDATVSHSLAFQFGGAQLSFEMSGPPQMHEPAAALVACNQIQGLFSLITTKDPQRADLTRLLPASQWKLLGWFPVQDWGNAHALTAAARVRDWPLLARIDTAAGYFKSVIRRRESGTAEWFWALEWNRSVRVIGAIYHEQGIPPVFQDLPRLDWRVVPGHNLRYRDEIPLGNNDDVLFA